MSKFNPEKKFAHNFGVGDIISDGTVQGVVVGRGWLGGILPMWFVNHYDQRLYIADALAVLVVSSADMLEIARLLDNEMKKDA